jgi:hypothetical protein
MKYYFLLIALLFFSFLLQAQNVGINNTDPKAALDLNGGFRLRPDNITVTGTNVVLASNRSHHVLIGSPVADFNIAFAGATENGQHAIITNTTLRKGFLVPIYIQPNTTVELIYSNAAWKIIGTNEPSSNTTWGLNGNAGLDTNKFIGTTDNNMLLFKVNNVNSGQLGYSNKNNTSFGVGSLPKLTNPTYAYFENTAIGDFSMGESKYGLDNTAVGYRSLSLNNSVGNTAIGAYALLNSINGQENTALGFYTLENNNGYNNVALGTRAMVFDTSGNENIAIGAHTMYNSKNSNKNVAVGTSAMNNLLNGNGNVAIGYEALYTDSSANGTISIGRAALYYNSNRFGNLAIGDSALFNNSQGATIPLQSTDNIAIGDHVLFKNATGYRNTATGSRSLYNNSLGYNNVANGHMALYSNLDGYFNTGIGAYSLYTNSTGTQNVGVGANSLYNNSRGSHNTANGTYTLYTNTDGSNNTSTGFKALYFNSSGSGNTALGDSSLLNNITGNYNVAIGVNSGLTNRTGSSNVFIGQFSGSNAKSFSKLYIGSYNPATHSTDSLNTLIYGDFAADSLLLNAKTVVRNNAVIKGYTKLGGYDTEVPSIKMKKISIPAGPAINAVQSYPLGSGITDAKVVGIQVLMNYAGSWKIPPAYIDAPGYEYNVQVQNNNIVVVLKNGNSANIGGKPISIIVTYEE